MNKLKWIFSQWISCQDYDAKFVDCWHIERVCGILKREIEENQTALVLCINKYWNEWNLRRIMWKYYKQN